jgi:hypothetical protein
VAICQSDSRNIRLNEISDQRSVQDEWGLGDRNGTIAHLVNVVPRRSGQVPLVPYPMLLHRHLPPALEHRVPRQLTHIRRGELIDLRGARVKWNWSGSSVERETLSPTRKKSLNGLRSYVRNKALLLSGLIARPICLR